MKMKKTLLWGSVGLFVLLGIMLLLNYDGSEYRAFVPVDGLNKESCMSAQYPETFPSSNATPESFDIFLPTFFCAIKNNKNNHYMSRIKFPLPYVVYHTEGTNNGEYQADQFDVVEISAGDGIENPPAIARHLIYGDRALVHIGFESTGSSHTWSFRRLNNLWHLVSVENGNY